MDTKPNATDKTEASAMGVHYATTLSTKPGPHRADRFNVWQVSNNQKRVEVRLQPGGDVFIQTRKGRRGMDVKSATVPFDTLHALLGVLIALHNGRAPSDSLNPETAEVDRTKFDAPDRRTYFAAYTRMLEHAKYLEWMRNLAQDCLSLVARNRWTKTPAVPAAAPGVPCSAQQEVCEMNLCEVPHLMLRPGQLYRFTTDERCPKCVEAAKPFADEQLTTPEHEICGCLHGSAAPQSGQLETIIDVLNSAFEADPYAMHALIRNEVPCNQALAEHPTVAVGENLVLQSSGNTVGMLGVISGICKAITGEDVAVMWSDPADEYGRRKMLGFAVYRPDAPAAN